jgi:hypothetical protein
MRAAWRADGKWSWLRKRPGILPVRRGPTSNPPFEDRLYQQNPDETTLAHPSTSVDWPVVCFRSYPLKDGLAAERDLR